MPGAVLCFLGATCGYKGRKRASSLFFGLPYIFHGKMVSSLQNSSPIGEIAINTYDSGP